jgi:hypothetical protein
MFVPNAPKFDCRPFFCRKTLYKICQGQIISVLHSVIFCYYGFCQVQSSQKQEARRYDTTGWDILTDLLKPQL